MQSAFCFSLSLSFSHLLCFFLSFFSYSSDPICFPFPAPLLHLECEFSSFLLLKIIMRRIFRQVCTVPLPSSILIRWNNVHVYFLIRFPGTTRIGYVRKRLHCYVMGDEEEKTCLEMLLLAYIHVAFRSRHTSHLSRRSLPHRHMFPKYSIAFLNKVLIAYSYLKRGIEIGGDDKCNDLQTTRWGCRRHVYLRKIDG